ncbi:hypothetical protein BB558_002901 [Smittium angustum]|uniref:beta-N-acetylhexosaminidase n=1 Tax=Smittium angustum TaxID=133377 RepID=A0A2U1J7J5_SMIAN|nr:hypothetical protein BB558_002901 [Smittium angustum]
MKISGIISVTVSLLAASIAQTPDDYVMDDCIKCQSVKCILSKMTVEEKITQKMIPEFRNWSVGSCGATSGVTVMNSEIASYLAKYKFGGVILFAPNTPQTQQTLVLVDDIQQANLQTNKIPLLVTIDQEGGAVTRLGQGTMLPGSMAVGATRNPNYASQCGQIIGEELSALGINANNAPDADINTNPLNPVINVRSFGSDTSLVAEYATLYYKGLASKNVIATAKHFPGHGDTTADSHFFLPNVTSSKDYVYSHELVPFQTAIDNGIDMIMTAHIQYPALDSTTIPSKAGGDIIVPATLSKVILNDILRGEMGFQGVVISDAMNMDAIVTNFGQVDSVRLSFQASLDFSLMPSIPTCLADPLMSVFDQIIAGVKQDIADGTYTMEELDASVTRILNLKKKYGILAYDGSNQAARITNALSVVGSADHKAIETQMANNAITLINNDPVRGIPLNIDANTKIAILMPEVAPEKQILAITQTLSELGINVPVIPFSYLNTQFSATAGQAQIDQATHVILGSQIIVNSPELDGGVINTVSNGWATTFPLNAINYANSKNKPIFTISLRSPYDVANFVNSTATLAAYGYKGYDAGVMMEPNIPAAIRVIFGNVKPVGKLPVDIYSPIDPTTIMYPYGYGLTI